jgi:hypothetical protein
LRDCTYCREAISAGGEEEEEEQGTILLLGTHEVHHYPQGIGALRTTKIGLGYVLSEMRDSESQEGFIKCCKAVFLYCN